MLRWLHLISTGFFIGATAGIPLFAVRGARRVTDAESRRARLVQALRVYDPLAIALLGIMVMTGAWSVTGYKETLGESYFASFGVHLAWKLAGAFLTVMAGTYLTFGIGHRLVRSADFGEPADERRIASSMARLSGAAWTTIALTAATIAIALQRSVP